MSNPRTADTSPPSPWAGLLGVAVIVTFGAFAVFDTSLRQSPASAQAAVAEEQPAAATSQTDAGPQAQAAQPLVLPLYHSEAGSHRPADSDPSSPGPDAPGLFE